MTWEDREFEKIAKRLAAEDPALAAKFTPPPARQGPGLWQQLLAKAETRMEARRRGQTPPRWRDA